MNDPEEQFLSPEEFEATTEMQISISDRYLEILGIVGGKKGSLTDMEFFFYADTLENAEGLAKDLEKLRYEIYGIHGSEEKQFCITGLVTGLSLEEYEFIAWIKKMNEIAFINNCTFDGWGTISELD